MGRFPSRFSHKPLFPKCFPFSLLKRVVKVQALVIFIIHRIQDNFFSSRDAFIPLNQKTHLGINMCFEIYFERAYKVESVFGRKTLIMRLISMKLYTNYIRSFMPFMAYQSSEQPCREATSGRAHNHLQHYAIVSRGMLKQSQGAGIDTLPFRSTLQSRVLKLVSTLSIKYWTSHPWAELHVSRATPSNFLVLIILVSGIGRCMGKWLVVSGETLQLKIVCVQLIFAFCIKFKYRCFIRVFFLKKTSCGFYNK